MTRMQSFWRTVSSAAQTLMRLLVGEHDTAHTAPSAQPQSCSRVASRSTGRVSRCGSPSACQCDNRSAAMAACTTAFAWVLTRPLVEPVYRAVLIPALGLFGLSFGLWYVGLT